jgi:alpha-glucuronidase
MSPEPRQPRLPEQPLEDGYALWLRYRPLPAPAAAALRDWVGPVWVPPGSGPSTELAVDELARGLQGLCGMRLRACAEPAEASLLLVHGGKWPALLAQAPEGVALRERLAGLDTEGHVLQALQLDGRRLTVLAAHDEVGLLRAAFAWLRLLQTGGTPEAVAVADAPGVRLRMLNHWDNLDRTVERGYAGQSIWDWWKLPALLSARYADYGRACASLGLNAVALNNVNAKPEVLSAPWIAKFAALADVLRPYGLRIFLSVRFSSPIELDGLPTADPLDPAVQAWWRAKADEIYRRIPDFGGFLVKANSEGQPGPRDYGRNHAEGANVFARALAPHGGVVFWRAFVYSEHNPADRHTQAYADFQPLDGQFAPNVVVQVKNGAIDFQPREPFHPLFGAMPNTALALELMVTKEYMGFSTHTAHLGLQYEEVLAAPTFRGGEPGSAGLTVAQVVMRPSRPGGLTAIAGVANVGSDRNWCGHHLDQANWYSFGRLAWQPQASSDAVAAEWVQQTFTQDLDAVAALVALLRLSREAVVNYMTPLGLHHLMATSHHHGPGPWVDDLARPEWNPTYYHRADAQGIGFDRSAAGSNAVGQYAPALAERWGRPESTPPELLLWFHHLAWNHAMPSGRTLWQELVARYDQGVQEAAELGERWQALKPHIDATRHADVAAHLAQQAREARWWRDACLAYFRSRSGLALPAGSPEPEHPLAHYQAIRFLHAPG